MLDEEFVHGLDAAFPGAYERARGHVAGDRAQVLKLAASDEDRARFLVRPYGAALLWWPYMRASMPIGSNPAPAFEAVVRIVLLVDRLHGWEPTEDEARAQIRRVLLHAFDPLELRTMFEKATGEGGKLAWAAPVVTPIVMPFLTPGGWFKLARKAPFALAWSLAIVTATLASIPLVTGWSIASGADRDARTAPRHVSSVETRIVPASDLGEPKPREMPRAEDAKPEGEGRLGRSSSGSSPA